MYLLLKHFLLIIVVFAFVTTMSKESLASCGDWLADSNSSMQAHSKDTAKDTKTASDSIPLQKLPTSSCSGPLCQQVPFAPMQPTPFEIELSSNDSLLLIAAKRDVMSCQKSSRQHDDDAASTGHRVTLDRPPQLAA